jgi:hypothetical protein
MFKTLCIFVFLLSSWQGYGQITRTTNIVVGTSPFQDSMWVINRADYSILKRLAPTVAAHIVTGTNGLATDPTTGINYAILKVSGIAGRQLATIDITTGVATIVGNLGDNFATIAFNANGTLFGVTGDGATVPTTMYRIDKATAAKTLFRTLGNGSDGEVIMYNHDNNYFYHWSGNGPVVYERFDTTGVDPIMNIPVSGTPGGETFGALYLDSGKILVSNISSQFLIWDTLGNVGATVASGLPDDLRGLVGSTCTSTVSPDGPLAFCSGGNVTFTVSSGAGNYQWYVDGGAIGGATNASFTATAGGHYNVIYTDSCGITDSLASGFAVVVNSSPSITLAAIPAVCQGTTTAILSYNNTIPFAFTGSMQTWTVPSGVDTITFDAQGARGGYRSGGTGTPGFGGRVQGKLAVTPGEVLNLFVGGSGATGSASGAAGGYNGGGTSVNFGGGGGGATDIRVGGTTLGDRIVVAGAGGGGGADGASINGGNGGNLIGGNGGPNPNPGTTPATGGSQVAGGVGADYPGWGTGSAGTLGLGGAGLNNPGSTYSAGGGAGYYGGGGGVWSGGGGGSSYTDPATTADVFHTQGFNNGNGFASISYQYPVGTTYSITWDAAAHTAGFADVTAATLPSSPISVAVPSGVAADVYNATVTINTGMCTSLPQAIALTVNPTPAAITGSTFECKGSTYTLISSSTGGTWTSSDIAIAGINGTTGSVTAVGVGTTTISYTLPTTCYTTATVTVNPQPSAIGGNSSLCFGSTATLTNDSTGGYWTSSNTFVATVGSTSGVVTTTGVGNSVMTYTLPAGCFSTTIVTVNPQPSAIGGASSLCLGNTYTLTNDSTGGAWSSSNTTVATIDPATGVVTTADSGNTTITYQLAGGCQSTLAVTVHPIPVMTSAAIAPNTCGGTTFNYVPASNVPVDSFTWMRTATSGISNASASGTGSISETLLDTVNVKTPVTYVYTLHLATCTSTYIVIDTVLPRPRLTTTTTPAAICDSTLFTYVPSSTQGGTAYSWVRPFVAGISSLTNSGIDNINEVLHNTANTNKNVIYTYTLTANGCSNTQDVTLVVHPKPVLTTLTSASICSGSTFDYTPANTLIIPVVSAWTRPAVSGILPATLGSGSNAIHETLTNTTSATLAVNYLYTLTVAGTACSNTQIVTVNVMPAAVAPTIATKSPANLCMNTMYQNFGAATAPPSGVTYHWSASNATIYAHGTTGQYALVNFPDSGMAVIRLAALYGALSCPAADSFMVNVGTTSSSTTLIVISTNGSLSALQNDVDTYQWGYDDAATLDSTLLAGENNQVYFPSAGLLAGRNYWVITRTGECMQKAYYTTPAGVTNVNDLTDVMNVYPNPAQQNVTVAVSAVVTGDITVEVTNLLGQKVASASAVNNQAHIAVAELPAGCYIVDCFANGTRIGTAKFIKN